MTENSIIDRHKSSCCGCGNCAIGCSKNAITMITDGEGFVYPTIDKGLCINCGICLKLCPFEIKTGTHTNNVLVCYSGAYSIREELKKSSSGGAAHAIACAFIKRGGVVYGAIYSDDCRSVRVERIDKQDDLYKLRGSKYAQTIKGDTFKCIKAEVQSQQKVLFIGLPCEIAALKRFVGKTNDLFTVELICSGNTSQKVHSEFIDYLNNKNHCIITNFTYRKKAKGWHWPYIEAKAGCKVVYSAPWSASMAGFAFKTLIRPSCYNCQYKGINNVADITVGDFWGVKKADTRHNSLGVSAIVVHTENGKYMLVGLEDFVLKNACYNDILAGNPRITQCIKEASNRKAFADILSKEGLVKAYSSCYTTKDYIKDIVKVLFANLNYKP
ncbi:Coenzyme F420 hydrogenase/dehydrogenase, beta subunit C-terminal domain [Bacteroides sp. BFG-257]|uniref:Coenzyme F420 hydrogenase/dehydrogenase, beta subunit C-terminal domain n=1 Tax=Bacteroides TaxID=816 RepID=UPI001CD00BDB|nr:MULTISPECIES: Coenzyme F420 hydrogenase/dehydrogenase, beta subunit C-terminal domain [Bacteroides]UBD67983.1 Coenzyme F420 hydrogenase/dehydrogenase, beta subunit C-terminal domain [Bacteroides cellulosilyticus]UVO96679.1 Coenzyme F420 hydrogenase/dehydrogenase, beta subunit C-terminal domain [Bacteroides sp. BFG-257]